ncbi:MAG: bifunctional metallophosphatase/5'-nucleotidase [Roseburia sp.]|nr:bifunctional metallophosphatase/5'-nucleotidase [Roseburia sp.]
MKKRFRGLAVLLAVVMLLLPMLPDTTVNAETESAKSIDVMFLHDLHSHMENFAVVEDGETKMLGGISQIKTLIDEQKAENPNTMILDAGDFSMGTLIQTVYETEAAELKMLGNIGCEVTTLGNHEFDYKGTGLANMMTTAATSGVTVPAMVLCNVDWETMEEAGLTENQQKLKDAFTAYNVQDYVVLQKGDVSVAVLGVFGKDSFACVPYADLLFEDPVEAARETVDEILANEDVDMIACVSHSGTWSDPDKSEDEILAKAVPEIDVIISGHTHTKLDEPIVHGNTYIVSCGEYGKRLGSFHMEMTGDGIWEMTEYELIEVTDDIPENEETKTQIEALMDSVDKDYLSKWGYTRNQVIAQNDVVFSSVSDLGSIHVDHNLGNIIADSYKYAVENAADFDGNRVDIAVAPSGTIRGSYPIGDITVADIYNSYSLGIGEDGVPGYPLISVYVTGEELKLALEIDASLSDIMTTARLYCAGVRFEFNPNRMILNRVTDCYLVGDNGERIEIEDDKLYRIVSDMYSGQMLGGVTDLSYGLLSLELKNADGTPIESLEDAIIYVDGEELKAWTTIASYMETFEDTDGDGTPNVPQTYAEEQTRKVASDSKNIFELIKNPNKYTAMIIGVVVVLIVLLLAIILLIKKLVKVIVSKVRRK